MLVRCRISLTSISSCVENPSPNILYGRSAIERILKCLAALTKASLLFIDYWMLAPRLKDDQYRDILEIMVDHHINRYMMNTIQFPVERWHEAIGDDTLADAIFELSLTTLTLSI